MKRLFTWIARIVLWLVVLALAFAAIVLLFPKQTADIKGASLVTAGLADVQTTENTIAVDHTSLDDAGVFALTNEERAENGNLPALTMNAKLMQAALNKANDMFANQYFAHVSPSGKGPGDIDHDVGYDYFLVGENLAEGDFTSDQDLLNAWMASPGHRANILNTQYQELGVAVVKGTYQGQTVWMAVQEFGVPSSDCTQTDPTLQAEIDADKATLTSDGANLISEKTAIEDYPSQRDATYQAMVQKYNADVDSYNALVNSSKVLITEYNSEAAAYNACAVAHGASDSTTTVSTEPAE